MNLYEATRNQLLNKSKSSEKGRQRFDRRKKSKVGNTVKSFNSIDMNKLFKKDILTVDIPVRGETDDYIVKITFGGFLEILRDQLRGKDTIDFRDVSRACIIGFNRDDVFTFCSCLHPDTKIKLLDGSVPTVAEMCERFNQGEQLYVYSVDDQGDFVPGVVEKVWITNSAQTHFIKVTLDNDEEIITTPEHLYMLRDGSYTEAANLMVGQSLMPLYFTERNGYELVKFNTTGRYHSVYKEVANVFHKELIEECRVRAQSDNSSAMHYDVAIHHKDFNKCNNTPENLEPKTAWEHWEYHAHLCGENRPVTDKMREVARQNAINRNAHPTENMRAARAAWRSKGILRNYDEDRKKQQAEIMRKNSLEFHASVDKDYYVKAAQKARENGAYEKLSASQKLNWDTNPERKRRASERIKGDLNPAKRPEVKAKMSSSAKRRGCNITDCKLLHKDDMYKYIHTDEIDKYLAMGWEYGGQPKSEEAKQKMRKAALSRAPFSEEKQREISQKLSTNIKAAAPKARLTRWKNNLNELLSSGVDVTYENFIDNRKNGEPDPLNYYDTFEDMLIDVGYNKEYNHKIVAIESLMLEETPVYDIKVKEHPNFLTAAGVILHNCPDSQYRFNFWNTKNNTNSGPPELRPSNITNPRDSLGSACKHVLLVLSNNSWILRVARVLVNYINYMEQHYQKMYADVIYPAIFGKKYEEPVQLDMEDETELITDKETISRATQAAREKGRFQKGNVQGVRFAANDENENQLEIENPDDQI